MTQLLLHIGMPKTGTSALQSALNQARGNLAQHGVLYPEPVRTNHDILAAGYRPLAELSRQYRQLYKDNPESLKADFHRWWSCLEAAVDRDQPRTIILSGELMSSPTRLAALHELLARITTNVRVIIYVRRPSHYFLSLTHQQLRLSSMITHWGSPGLLRFRPLIEGYAAEFPVEVIAYERDNFENQHIVFDFIQRFIPSTRPVFDMITPEPVNPSYSPEAMAIMQQFRLQNYPTQDNFYSGETHFFLVALEEASAVCNCNPLILKEEIALQIDYSNSDLLWLRDKFGVTFSGLDYAKIGSLAAVISNKRLSVQDICTVDPVAYSQLSMQVMFNLTHRMCHLQNRIRDISG